MTANPPAGYTLVRQLGRGAGGPVYLARQDSLGREVALKALTVREGVDDDAKSRFINEGRTLASLRNPAVISIYDISFADDAVWLVTQYIDGQDLQQLLGTGILIGKPVALRWILQIGRALEAANNLGIVHRDVKPANILIDGQGDAFLADFGVAELTRSLDGKPTGALVGTPAYMAPEQIRSEAVDGRTDLYALALLSYLLLAGEHPFLAGSSSLVDLLDAQLTESPLHGKVLELPEPIVTCLAHGLAKDPARRPASVGSFCDELAAAADDAYPGWRSVGRLPRPARPTPAPPKKSAMSRSSVIVLICLVGALVGAAIGLFLALD